MAPDSPSPGRGVVASVPHEESGPVATRTAPNNNDLADSVPAHPRVTDLPHARAYAGPPVPGRRLWAITVLSCALCGGMHQHRAGEVARLLSGRVTKTCPTSGKPYVLAPVQRRREARR